MHESRFMASVWKDKKHVLLLYTRAQPTTLLVCPCKPFHVEMGPLETIFQHHLCIWNIQRMCGERMLPTNSVHHIALKIGHINGGIEYSFFYLIWPWWKCFWFILTNARILLWFAKLWVISDLEPTYVKHYYKIGDKEKKRSSVLHEEDMDIAIQYIWRKGMLEWYAISLNTKTWRYHTIIVLLVMTSLCVSKVQTHVFKYITIVFADNASKI